MERATEGGGSVERHFFMKQYFKMLKNKAFMCISYSLLTAVSNCAHLLSACSKEESGVLYSEAQPIKGCQN